MKSLQKLKDKICKHCGETFTPFRPLQKVCSPHCAYKFTQSEKERKAEKEFNAETRRLKEKIKRKSEWAKEAQDACNKYIRARDKNEGCISCDKPPTWGGQWHASHYRPQGNCSALRFHQMNIHKSCSECNNHKSGNLTEYRIRLIQKIGLDNVEWLEAQNQPHKWEVEDLKEVKKYYTEKAKRLEDIDE